MKKHVTTVRAPVPEGIVLEENVAIQMRDGILVSADIYRPQKDGQHPAILSMSPYIKEIQQWPPVISHSIEAGNTAYFVRNDYVHVIVSVRGSGLSQGRWSPFDAAQQQDGYDLIEWIAEQPWCNGRVTMLGDSYFAIMQWLVALQHPPHLSCIAPVDGCTDFYRDFAWKGGLFNSRFIGMWGSDTLAQCFWPGDVDGKLPPANLFNEFLSHPEDGPYWWDISSWTRLHEIDVPVLSVVPQPSYNHSRGQLWGYQQLECPKKLVVLPWNPQSHVIFMESEPLNAHILRWFDHWCKDIDTGIMSEPEVAICDSATGEWWHEAEYPLARTRWTQYYFRTGVDGPATEPPYGRLSEEPPGLESADVFATGSRLPFTTDMSHDPRTPPETAKTLAGEPQIAFASEPLPEPLRVWGPISVTVWASTNTLDSAFFTKLGDIDPDGNRRIISEYVLKASHRAIDETRSTPGQPFHPYMRPERPERDVAYEYQIELPPKFWTFGAGHRIWLGISADENEYHLMLHTTYTAELLPVPGTMTVFHDEDHPSHLLLPVIPGAAELPPVASPLANVRWPLT